MLNMGLYTIDLYQNIDMLPLIIPKYNILLRSRYSHIYHQIPSTLLPIRYGWILNDGRYDFDWFHGEECPQKVCDITAPDEESGEENDDVIGKLINLNIFNLYVRL
ncbi:hypothetical protein ACJJTC_005130 [Scirpophaga incertulas]